MEITKDIHRRFLMRTSRKLSRELGKKIGPKDVLEALLDMAIADEARFDPSDELVIAAGRRQIKGAVAGLSPEKTAA